VGHAIVYCDVCGDRILDEEFERRRAVTVQNKSYCPTCAKNVFGSSMPEVDTRPRSHVMKPEPEPPRPPTAIRPPRPTAIRPAPASGPSQGVIIGAVAGALGVLGIVVMAFALRGGSSEPVRPAPTRDDLAREALAPLEQMAASADPERVLAKAAEVRPKVAGTTYESRLAEIEERARTRKADLEREKDVDRLLAELVKMLKEDTEFAHLDRFRELVATAQRAATGALRSKADEITRVSTNYETAFQQAATAKADDLRRRADALAVEKKFADAVRLIEDGYAGVWRRSDAWTALDARRRELQELAMKPPEPGGKKDRFGILVVDPPKAGVWVTVVDGSSLTGWFRYGQANEQESNWSIVGGELVGASSRALSSEQAQDYGDMLFSMSDAYTDLEMELSVRMEQGTLLVGVRYEPGMNSQPKVASAQVGVNATWQKLRFVIEGGSGKIVVDGAQEVVLNMAASAPTGRVILGLSPGAKVRIKDFKLLRKK